MRVWPLLSLGRANIEVRQLFSTFCVNVKMQYTLNQRLFLVKQYWITNSITATQRAYQREFGVRNPPKRNTILGLVNKLETTGSLTELQNDPDFVEYDTINKPHFLRQDLNELVWDLGLSKRKAELLASRFKSWNLLQVTPKFGSPLIDGEGNRNPAIVNRSHGN
ncbi:hypothetical protein ANN_09194 [Periplaneta americana]|uniref:DUF4817 domain-containing protein n=1 Tax=Periplaneta americana TaxID=6978 RepID=A0ABQ8TKP9_PERAM|nr:hypothetical protein ANN_09194 [Periplaneta americana]